MYMFEVIIFCRLLRYGELNRPFSSSFAEYEMSEVMVITGSGSNKATFEGRSTNLSEIVSVGNGVHSRNGSLRGNINGFKCRCMANAATAATASADEASASDKDSPAEAEATAPAAAASSTTSTVATSTEPVKKEHKSTQTALSTVNVGINGGIIGSTRALDVVYGGGGSSGGGSTSTGGSGSGEHPPVDNALSNQLSI